MIVADSCSAKQWDLLFLKAHQNILSTAYSKIEFVEIIGRTLYFHLGDGTLRGITAPLSEYESILFFTKITSVNNKTDLDQVLFH
jgi:DNA-binding LytR/AlgR family response regulator